MTTSTKFRSDTSFHASKSPEVAPQAGFRNRVKTTLNNVFQPGTKKQRLRRRSIMVGVASALVALFVRPAITLAMGGMGGSKGPVAPMER